MQCHDIHRSGSAVACYLLVSFCPGYVRGTTQQNQSKPCGTFHKNDWSTGSILSHPKTMQANGNDILCLFLDSYSYATAGKIAGASSCTQSRNSPHSVQCLTTVVSSWLTTNEIAWSNNCKYSPSTKSRPIRTRRDKARGYPALLDSWLL